MQFNYEEYKNSHEFKDAQINALGEALEECIEDVSNIEKKYQQKELELKLISICLNKLLTEVDTMCNTTVDEDYLKMLVEQIRKEVGWILEKEFDK